MDLNSYVDSVKHGVTEAAALADESTQQVAQRLGGALDSATRLALIRALSDAAGTISADLAPTSVELRMNGADPEFVVRVPRADGEPTLLLPQPPEPPPAPESAETVEPGDEAMARISLRLPASVKEKVDEMADRDGISTNAWLIRAVVDALGERRERTGPETLRSVLGSIGPFGPDGPFGPHGVFGPHGPFGENERNRGERSERADRRTGNVQGWVR